jgi:hypothetical protein
MRADSLWDNSKVLHDKGDALEQKDAHVMKALGLDVQFLIDARKHQGMQVLSFKWLFSHSIFNFCLYKLHYQFKLMMIEYIVSVIAIVHSCTRAWPTILDAWTFSR